MSGAFQRAQFEDLCLGNPYAATISVLNTGIAKMTALMESERKPKRASPEPPPEQGLARI